MRPEAVDNYLKEVYIPLTAVEPIDGLIIILAFGRLKILDQVTSQLH
jgi:hypothetical protein